MGDTSTFVTLPRAARRLGVPESFLLREARAGRVPSLSAGRRLLFRVEDVERALVERSQAVTAPMRTTADAVGVGA